MKKVLLLLLVLVGCLSASADTWTKVTSVDDLVFGEDQEYVIVYNASTIMGCEIGSNKYLPKVDLNATEHFAEDKLKALPSGTAIVKLEGSVSSAKLHLFSEDGTSKGYYTTTKATNCTLGDTGTDASVTITDGNFIATFGTLGSLQYNLSSPRFVNYTSDQKTVQIYKKDVFIEDGRTKATLKFEETECQVAINDNSFVLPTLIVEPEEARSEIKFKSYNETVVKVDEKTGAITLVGEGSTRVEAYISDNETYYDASASFAITVYDPSNVVLKFSDLGYNANTSLQPNYTIGVVTFSFDKGKGSTAPAYNSKDNGARIYAGNTITITAEDGYCLRSVKFLDSSDEEVTKIISGATVTNGILSGATWTPGNRYVNSFVFTNGGTSGNTPIDHIVVRLVSIDDLELEDYTDAQFTDYEIQTNEEVTFTFPDYAPEVKFTSSDENVIVVEGNVLKPVGAGEATITASWEEGNGWKTGSKEFKVTVIQALLDPVFEIVGETAIVVSEEDDLTVEFKYEGVENPVFTITSSKPEYATATVDAATKTITVDILRRGTTEFTLSVAGDDTYDKASIKFSVKVCYKDLASILEHAVVGETYTGVFPVTLVYEHNSYNYVTDGTAWALFYVDKNDVENHIHGAGAVIPAGWTAKYTVYNKLPEFTEIEHDAEIADHETVEIEVCNEVTADMINHVVILKNVEFEEPTKENSGNTVVNFDGIFNDAHYTFRNQFDLSSVPAGIYDVKVAVNVYNDAIQLYPIEYIPVPVYSVDVVSEVSRAMSDGVDCNELNILIGLSCVGGEVGNLEDYTLYMNEVALGTLEEEYFANLPYVEGAVYTVRKDGAVVATLENPWKDVLSSTAKVVNPVYTVYTDKATEGMGHVSASFNLDVETNLDTYFVDFYFENEAGEQLYELKLDVENGIDNVNPTAHLTWKDNEPFCEIHNLAVVDLNNIDYTDINFGIKVVPTFPFLMNNVAAPAAAAQRAPRAAELAISYVSATPTTISHEHMTNAKSEVSGVVDVVVDGEGVVEFYNLQGVKVEGELVPGLYIRRQGNAATKVVVR